ncbi:MAG: sugar kinase [Thermomicrobiales bacterium]
MRSRTTSASQTASIDVLSFGETMIRLATPGFDRLETTATLDISIGGTESNVAVALARLGRRATWLSALPANPLGRRIAATLRFHGVDTSQIIWEPSGRAGIYFLEPGTAPRPTRVIYDRAGSAVAGIDPDSISYALVSSSRLLHLTGITPALSEGCAESCRRLVEQAGRASVPLMFDVNYRGLLWSPEEAAAGIQFFLDHVDLLFCGAGDARTIWQLDGKPEHVARELLDRSSARLVIVTSGHAGATAVSRSGDIWHQPAPLVDIIDPVGAGDAFAAGFVDAWLDDQDDVATALRSAVASASIAMTIPGDLAVITREELSAAVEALDRLGDDIVR